MNGQSIGSARMPAFSLRCSQATFDAPVNAFCVALLSFMPSGSRIRAFSVSSQLLSEYFSTRSPATTNRLFT